MEFCGEFCSTKDVDHEFEVVGHGGEADFGLCAVGAAQQQARMAEDMVLQGGEWMLDGRASEPHRLGRGPCVHAVEPIFVEQSHHQPLRGSSAARLSCAVTAVGPVGAVVDGLVLAGEAAYA